MKQYYAFLIVSLLVIQYSFAQSDLAKGWHLQDLKKDSVYGISLTDAYLFLKQKKIKPVPVIVAVIDSGIDTTQEDLKNVLWNNPKEINGNNKDDDHNGYIDDVHGWNFLGNANRENLVKSPDEKIRIYHAFKDSFLKKEWKDTATMSFKQKFLYKAWLRAAKKLDIKPEDYTNYEVLEASVKELKRLNRIIITEIDTAEYTISYLEKHITKTREGKEAKNQYLQYAGLLGIESDEKNTTTLTELDDYIENKRKELVGKESKPEEVRANIIKDNYTDINDKYYGNNDVTGPSSLHGTHVAGIIAAQRNNGIGIDGIADNARIMILRAVPEGDEYDKDIALAIIYAADNGAKVINMSFGKEYSPEKYWVDSAIRYALKKDVLIIHSAGNDAENLDSIESYPSAYSEFYKNKASNIIVVGASSSNNYGNGSVIADFSNYSKHNVDILAPGVKIYSTLPPTNQYGNLNGTSMAAPVVSGVATLIRSYFPKLNYAQVKEAILKSVTYTDSTVTNFKPGNSDVKVNLLDMCVTGGVINAARAVENAYNISESMKHKKIQ